MRDAALDTKLNRPYAWATETLTGCSNQMLINALLEACRRVPNSTAVEDPFRSLTYRQMTRLAVVIRDIVRRKSKAKHIGIMLPASSFFPPVLFGVLWARLVAVPLNFLLAPDELAGVVKDAGLDLIVTVRHFASLAQKLSTEAIYLEDLGLKRRMLFRTVLPLPAPPSVESNETAVLLYTSGTTAQPRGVELTYQNLSRNAADAVVALGIEPPQTMLNVLPPFHVFGLTGSVLVPVVLGAKVVAIPRFHPATVVRAIATSRVTVMMAIPSMYAAMLRTKSAKADDFRSVKLALSGGEPLSDAVREGFLQRFNVQLREGYGLTETSPVVTISSLRYYKPGAVGQAIPNVELCLRDDKGQDVARGLDGEILVKGPGVMKGYYNRPEETRAVLSGDGWFATGDIGRLDEDGFLSITGRAKEMLIIGGENVFPREIESALEQHDAVLQAAVIGMPDPSRGELPAAFVIPVEGAAPTEIELRSFAKKRLAGFKVPKRVLVRTDLPVGPTGKILKRKLRELL